MWSPRLDAVSRDELISIQNEKLNAAIPFLYENSPFYRRRFERFGMLPSDIRSVDDLHKWPVVDKAEMMADAEKHPPYGTYTTVDESVWAKRGWMMFSSSGSTGAPRVFRYTHAERRNPRKSTFLYLHVSLMLSRTRKSRSPFSVVGPSITRRTDAKAFTACSALLLFQGTSSKSKKVNILLRFFCKRLTSFSAASLVTK
jgi:phenylacetate-coenzyme A ligase PaaK-like adenylate-forming protein